MGTNFEKEIKEEAEKMLRYGMMKAKNDATKMAIKHRRELTTKWFTEEAADPWSVLDIIRAYDTKSKKTGELEWELVIETYLEDESYEEKESFEKWKAKHPYGGQDSSSDFILNNLQLKQGIIGLPRRASYYKKTHGGREYHRPDLGWKHGVNMLFIKRPYGLDEYIQDDNNWNDAMDSIGDIIIEKIIK